MARKRSYRRIVREIGLDHYGYVSTQEAIKMGVPSIELPKLSARGGLDNVAYGLYRLTDILPTPYDQYAEALFRVGEGAYLHGESVLALFGFADVNPRQVNVAIPRRTRSKLPRYIALTQTDPGAPTTIYEGLASQPVADALIECEGHIETSRLLAAAEQARTEGLLTTTEWQLVRKRFQS